MYISLIERNKMQNNDDEAGGGEKENEMSFYICC